MSTTTIPRFEKRHRLALALDHADVSVSDMADVLGVSRNTVGNYLSGRTKPPTAAVKVWALRCGVPYEWLEHGVIDLGHPDPERDSGRDPKAPAASEYAPRDSNPEPVDCQIMPLTRRGTHPTPHAEPVAA